MLGAFFDAIVTTITNFIIWVIDMFPTFAFEMTPSLSGFIELITKTSYFVPWDTLLVAIGVWIAFQNTRFVVSLINWIISKIPGVS